VEDELDGASVSAEEREEEESLRSVFAGLNFVAAAAAFFKLRVTSQIPQHALTGKIVTRTWMKSE
jgi:hypothetical protein